MTQQRGSQQSRGQLDQYLAFPSGVKAEGCSDDVSGGWLRHWFEPHDANNYRGYSTPSPTYVRDWERGSFVCKTPELTAASLRYVASEGTECARVAIATASRSANSTSLLQPKAPKWEWVESWSARCTAQLFDASQAWQEHCTEHLCFFLLKQQAQPSF